MVANILPTDTSSTQGVGSKGQTISFSESSLVAYQIKENWAQSTMKANMLSLHTHQRPLGWGQKLIFLFYKWSCCMSNFITHIKYLKAKCLKALNLLKVLSHTSWGADRTTLLKLYRSLVRSKLDYGCIIYGSARKSYLQMLDPIHNQGLRLALGAFRTSPVARLYVEADEPSLYSLTHQILLMKLHSHQIMLIYMNKNLKLLNHLASEFHHS